MIDWYDARSEGGDDVVGVVSRVFSKGSSRIDPLETCGTRPASSILRVGCEV